jgi:predicted nucleic acid-binding protein
LNKLPIRVETPPHAESLMTGILPITRRHDLTSHDASYLHLAIRNGIDDLLWDKQVGAGCGMIVKM